MVRSNPGSKTPTYKQLADSTHLPITSQTHEENPNAEPDPSGVKHTSPGFERSRRESTKRYPGVNRPPTHKRSGSRDRRMRQPKEPRLPLRDWKERVDHTHNTNTFRDGLSLQPKVKAGIGRDLSGSGPKQKNASAHNEQRKRYKSNDDQLSLRGHLLVTY
jgi:hypothetical protein